MPVVNRLWVGVARCLLWATAHSRLFGQAGNPFDRPIGGLDYDPVSEVAEFRLACVVSGKDAVSLHRIQQIGLASTDGLAGLELAMLRLPEEAHRLPSHRIRYTGSFGALMHTFSKDPGAFEGSLSGESKRILRSAPRLAPRPDDYETVLNFAKMSSDAYIVHAIEGDWRNMTDYTKVDDFGWDGTGLRGYVFGNADSSIVVVSFKGTSTMFGGGDTVSEDKYMDNLMFSCCCARVDISWTPVCGCYMGSQRCNQTCIEEAVGSSEVSYYQEAKAVVDLVRQKWARAQIWFTGHSLGGAIAALMAVTYPKTAAITWESPGASLYAQRLGLHGSDPRDLSRYPIWNFGISTDPIYLGTCAGITSGCYLSGYAMESKCRQGQDCLFVLKNRLANINTHRIDWVIENVLEKPDKYELPECAPPLNCTECEEWSFLRELPEASEL